MFHNLCDFIKEEMQDLDRKVASGGSLSMPEIEYADKLSHIKKSILTVEAMENPEEYGYNDDSYSRGYNDGYSDGSYGESYNDGSYNGYSEGGSGSGSSGGGYGARGRGRNARRDSMGRYARSSRMYRDDKDMMSELQQLMNKAPNEQVKQKYQQFISEVKNMM